MDVKAKGEESKDGSEGALGALDEAGAVCGGCGGCGAATAHMHRMLHVPLASAMYIESMFLAWSK
jgi:hypothetical protein